MRNEITVAARVENIEAVTDFANECLDAAGCPMRAKMQLDIAIDELFSNIARYAYRGVEGQVTLRVEIEEDPRAAILTFIDGGETFDPLERDDPDVTLSVDEREIGGLGIFLVRQSMDEVQYERMDGENRLKVVKKW